MQHQKSVYLYTVHKPQIILTKILSDCRSTVSKEAVLQVSWAMMNFILQLEDNVTMQLNMSISIKSAELRLRLFTNLLLIIVISASKINYGIFNPRFSINYHITCSLWCPLINRISYLMHSWFLIQVELILPWLIFKLSAL